MHGCIPSRRASDRGDRYGKHDNGTFHAPSRSGPILSLPIADVLRYHYQLTKWQKLEMNAEGRRRGRAEMPTVAQISRSRLWRRHRPGFHQAVVSSAMQSVLILLVSTLVYLAIGEVAARLAMRVPLTDWRDFRHERTTATINKAVEYDSLLGWRLKPHLTSAGFNTVDYGFRSNGDASAKVKPGGVLAVGSSFTAGSEVTDDQSWPAQLQQMTGWNVNNGGEGGYQADQIVLLAEQLLPLIRPQVMVVDLIPGTIIGTGYSSSGWPKPYFTIETGALAMHNSPVPQDKTAASDRADIKGYLGHFAVLDQFMTAFFNRFWFTADGSSFSTVVTDEVGVTCRLLARLKQKTDAADIRLLLYLQYGGLEIVDSNRMAATMGSGLYHRTKRWLKTKLSPLLLNTPPGAPDWYEAAMETSKCARSLGMQVVDELPTLRAAYDRNPADLYKYYQTEADGAMGHKSPFGNIEVAKLIAKTIRELSPPVDQQLK
jgi:hypothetical protein